MNRERKRRKYVDNLNVFIKEKNINGKIIKFLKIDKFITL